MLVLVLVLVLLELLQRRGGFEHPSRERLAEGDKRHHRPAQQVDEKAQRRPGPRRRPPHQSQKPAGDGKESNDMERNEKGGGEE